MKRSLFPALLIVLLAAPAVAQSAQTEPLAAAVLPATRPAAAAPAVADVQGAVSSDAFAARLRALRTLSAPGGQTLAQQVNTHIRSSNPAVREQGLREVVYYAANFGDIVDLSASGGALLDVFASDPNPGHRIMASQAIVHLGQTDQVREMVQLSLRDPSAEVRRLALYAAAYHFGLIPQ